MTRPAVGIGILPRGEVGLIFAGIGTSLVIGGRSAFDQRLFSGVVPMILATMIVAPAGLRWAVCRRSERPASRAVPSDDPP